MKFKCFTFFISLLVGCFGLSNCKASENIRDDINGVKDTSLIVSSSESQIDDILSEYKQLKGQVEKLSKDIENLKGKGSSGSNYDLLIDKLWKVLVCVSFVFAIIALVYAHRIFVNDKRFVGITNKRIDDLKISLMSLKPVVKRAPDTDFQRFEERLSNIEKSLEGFKGSEGVGSGPNEIELSSHDIKTGYFTFPSSGAAGNLYFDKFLPIKEGLSCFKVEMDGDNATFEPISLREIRYDITDPVIDFSGDVTKAQAQGMDVLEKGMAVRQNDGRWLMTKKTRIILK